MQGTKLPYYAIISVIGSHAGEDIATIFKRKQEEIEQTGTSYWLIKSFKAKPGAVQDIGKRAAAEAQEVICFFIDSSQRNGARPTSHDAAASFTSKDGITWESVPAGIRVTGKLDMQSTALVLKKLTVLDETHSLDLWEYSEFADDVPVKLQLGASTVCCTKRASSGMKSRERRIVAIATLAAPYAVWVK